MDWDPRSLPSQEGKTFIVTGGSSGIGYFVCEQLASTGARVVIAARNEGKANAAMSAIRATVPDANLAFVHLDLDSLASVATAAGALSQLGPIDALALNAGLTSGSRRRGVTADGLERAVGTNYLGHFALVARTFAALAPSAVVVPMGSLATTLRRANLDDLLLERGYSWSRAYAYSKHAMQAFGFEFDRRLRARGSGIRSIVAHPGFATDVQAPLRSGINELGGGERLGQNLVRFMTQGRDQGAWPMVRALLDPTIAGGEFVGPPGRGLRGLPGVAKPVPQDRDPNFGRALWTLSQTLTGVTFAV